MGDRVLVRNVGIRGKHKIADCWTETILTVDRDSPVYAVVPGNTEGPEKVLRRDLLLPSGFLPSIDNEVCFKNSKSRNQMIRD